MKKPFSPLSFLFRSLLADPFGFFSRDSRTLAARFWAWTIFTSGESNLGYLGGDHLRTVTLFFARKSREMPPLHSKCRGPNPSSLVSLLFASTRLGAIDASIRRTVCLSACTTQPAFPSDWPLAYPWKAAHEIQKAAPIAEGMRSASPILLHFGTYAANSCASHHYSNGFFIDFTRSVVRYEISLPQCAVSCEWRSFSAYRYRRAREGRAFP